ncbi:MAG: hypothetical protein BZY80_01155 [SAR202 cluster bacterium Io17-Chloro-G2]|nr:MAG: hypothetical protein BZY80_01155 [SAR202 cluster bacterium Io17-Chloro-G2]
MAIQPEVALNILERLGQQPAVAFHEHGVARAIHEILAESGISPAIDGFGNIIAKVPGSDPAATPIALVAHMDHPGFEAVASDGDLVVASALGGIPAGAFAEGVPVQIVLEDGWRLRGTVAGRHGEESQRQVLISLDQPQSLDFPRPVVFDLTSFQIDGDFIHMRAADDLAGCASILAALASLAALTVLRDTNPELQPAGDVYGVFTRAEEVGLVGARLMAAAGTLPANTLVVSAESSRTLPGAEMGKGPVIRVGDAGLTFNADAEAALIKAKEILQERPEGFKSQRQLMSGGVCEASAFALHGYKTTGLAFPLGNYHNGAPGDAIGAEYIHRDDFIGGVELMVEAAQQVANRDTTNFRQRIGPVSDEFRERLRPSG